MAYDVTEASELANRLESLNRERQALTDQAYVRAREEVLTSPQLPYMLVVAGEWLTPGICGLVASKLVEEFYRPAVVIALKGDVARASARTIPELNIVEALSSSGELLTRYGGHPQAAGFVAPRSALPEISRRLEEYAQCLLKPMELRPRLLIDAEVPLHNLTGEAYRLLKRVEPYGVGNPVPVFRTVNVEVLEARAPGGDAQHLFLRLRHGGAVWDGIAFNHAASVDLKGARVDLVYTLRTRSFSGTRTLALNVLDFRPSGKLG
jgi:single-stranded-DNA-specific exonuclease